MIEVCIELQQLSEDVGCGILILVVQIPVLYTSSTDTCT